MKKLFAILFCGAMLVGFSSCEKNDSTDDTPQLDLKVDFEAIDLGLPSGILWAPCNVGATKSEETGDYFAWGETKPKQDYSYETLKYWDVTTNLSTKYTGADLTILETMDDAASVNWGGNWRTPTKAEFQELVDYCTWTWTSTAMEDMYGFQVTGPNGNSIFLLAAGYCYKTNLKRDLGWEGAYWCSSLSEKRADAAWVLFFDEGGIDVDYDFRIYGRSIRPVCSPVK